MISCKSHLWDARNCHRHHLKLSHDLSILLNSSIRHVERFLICLSTTIIQWRTYVALYIWTSRYDLWTYHERSAMWSRWVLPPISWGSTLREYLYFSRLIGICLLDVVHIPKLNLGSKRSTYRYVTENMLKNHSVNFVFLCLVRSRYLRLICSSSLLQLRFITSSDWSGEKFFHIIEVRTLLKIPNNMDDHTVFWIT